MGILSRFFLKKRLKKLRKPDFLDDVIKEELKRSAEVQRLAEKILKVKTLRQQTDRTLEKIKDLSDEEADEEEEENGGVEELITKAIIQKVLNVPLSPSGVTESLEKKAEKIGLSEEAINKIKKEVFK